MSDIDKVAKAEGIRFRHFHDKHGRLVATLATAWNKHGKITCALSMCHTVKPFYKEAKNVLNTLKSIARSSSSGAMNQDCENLLQDVKNLSNRGDTGSKEDGKIRAFNRLKECLGDGHAEMCTSLTPNEVSLAIRGGFILDYFPVPKVELMEPRLRDPDGPPNRFMRMDGKLHSL